MTTLQMPFPGTIRYRVTNMTWDNGTEGKGEATYGDGCWFVREDEHSACCNWLRAEIRRLHRENESLRAAMNRPAQT